MSIKGLTALKHYRKDIVSKLSCKRISLEPKQISIFKIKIIKKLVATGALWDIYLKTVNDERTLAIDAPSNLLDPLCIYSIEKEISRMFPEIFVDSLIVNIYLENTLVLKIVANKAIIHSQKRYLELTNVFLWNSRYEKSIIAKRALINIDNRIIYIPETFLVLTGNKKQPGEKMIIDFDFNMSSQGSDRIFE